MMTDSSAEHRRLNAQSPAVRQALRMLERLDAGENVIDFPPSARQHPELTSVPWIADRSVSRVIVRADDTIHPA
jgi:hypothetical protein